MSNIFDGIKKMSDSEIRMQIALLKDVTVLNVAKETGNRLLGGLTNLANAFSETFSRKTPFEYQVIRVSDVVKQETSKLMSKERVQLEYELKKALVDRCNELLSKPLELEMGEDRISLFLVTEAAKTYGMEQYLTQGRKIEQIQADYHKMFLQSLHNIMIRQTEADRNRMDQDIQKRLNEVSMETKRELQKRLMPKEFSGKGIGRLLRLEKSTKYLSYTIELLGCECFDYVNTDIVTVLNTVKGLKRITRVLLTQFVWAAANAHAGRFVVPEDILPGYVSAQLRDEQSAKEKAFRSILLDREKAQKQLEKCDTSLEKVEIELNDIRDRFELESREYDEAQMEFMGYESKKDEYIAGRHSQDDTKTYYANVNSSKRKLDSAQSDFNKWKNKLHDTTSKKKKLESERNTALLNLEVVKSKTDGEIDQFAHQLMNNWIAFYYKFQFDHTVFQKVVIDFTKEEQLRIEEMLKEMHDSKDINAFAVETENPSDNVTDHASGNTSGSASDNTSDHASDKVSDDATNSNMDQAAGDVTGNTTSNPAGNTTGNTTGSAGTTKTYVNVSNGKNAYIRYQDHKILEIGKA